MIKITYTMVDDNIHCNIEWDNPESDESKNGFFIWALVDIWKNVLTDKQRRRVSRRSHEIAEEYGFHIININ